MTVKDAVLETFDNLPSPKQKELLRFAQQLESEVRAERRSARTAEKKPRKARIVDDPVTGLPVLSIDPNTPLLTSEMVREILADFP